MILFDLAATQPFGNIKRHGGGKYGEIVFKKICMRHYDVVCFYDSRKWLNPEIESLIRSNNIDLFDLSQMSLSEIVDKSGCTLIYSPLDGTIIHDINKCSIVTTVHGLRRLETPADSYVFKYKKSTLKDYLFFLYKYFAPNLFKRHLIKFYRKRWNNPNFRFVTVSNHSANALRTFFPEFRNLNIPVFYSPSTSQKNNLSSRYNEKYFLIVSGGRFEKNNLRAIEALDMLYSKGYIESFFVKITGVKDSSAYRYSLKNPDRFHFMGYVDDAELEQLYHDAYALLYPSLNEGFGYPPLEAMHYGVPVLASPFTSISEICQGASIYFNPYDIDEIANRILQISDQDTHNEYSRRSLEQFSIITEKQEKDLDALIDFLYT